MLLAQNRHTRTGAAAHHTSLFTFGYQCSFSAIQINTRTSATLGEDHHTSNTSQERSQSAFRFHGEVHSIGSSRHWRTEANLQ